LAEVVAPEAVLLLTGETPLAGAHRGPDGIATLRRLIAALTGDTWRPLRDLIHYRDSLRPCGTTPIALLRRATFRQTRAATTTSAGR
jgi:hypothetical protein